MSLVVSCRLTSDAAQPVGAAGRLIDLWSMVDGPGSERQDPGYWQQQLRTVEPSWFCDVAMAACSARAMGPSAGFELILRVAAQRSDPASLVGLPYLAGGLQNMGVQLDTWQQRGTLADLLTSHDECAAFYALDRLLQEGHVDAELRTRAQVLADSLLAGLRRTRDVDTGLQINWVIKSMAMRRVGAWICMRMAAGDREAAAGFLARLDRANAAR